MTSRIRPDRFIMDHGRAIMPSVRSKEYDYDADTIDDPDHKNDSYTAAGAAPGASIII